MSWYAWRPYVPLAARQAQALKRMDSLRKKGQRIQPVKIEGRTIARSFWGQAWCDHLEKFSDYENRLPRGRAYVRNGSVCHLDIAEGAVKAMVSGSDLYNVNIEIRKLAKNKWAQVRNRCAGQIGSLLELLQGKLSKGVMAVVTDRDSGLFPHPGEITLHCTCPDWAVMCKHVAAVLYGVGARLDEKPELLFLLRGVDYEELICEGAGLSSVSGASERAGSPRIAEGDLSHLFGIEMAESEATVPRKRASKPASSARKELTHALPRTRTIGKRDLPGEAPQGQEAVEYPLKMNARQRSGAGTKASRGRPSAQPRVREPSAAVTGVGTAAGKAVARLRRKFVMSRAQFAQILGVSPSTVANWEKAEGPLNLRASTRKAWNAVSKFSKAEARQRLPGLD
ncbi:MAG: antitoxin Xre-like helix-turn-helix domain-containing protein [Thermodesulfobacteriota bacterium]